MRLGHVAEAPLDELDPEAVQARLVSAPEPIGVADVEQAVAGREFGMWGIALVLAPTTHR